MYYHGSDTEMSIEDIRTGLCLTTDRDVAESYGPAVHSCRVSLGGLVVEKVAYSDGQLFPGDEDAQTYLDRGVDAILYSDSNDGEDHETLRLLSQKALNAIWDWGIDD